MTAILDLWSKSPARIVAFVAAVLVLLVAFGVQITTGQSEAILGAVGALITLLGGEITRSQVTSPNTVAELKTGNALSGPSNATTGPVTPVPTGSQPS
jgi:uncharacterized membrane protein